MEKPLENSTISLHLSRVLDEIGLNELTVEKRREASLFEEQIETLNSKTYSYVSMYIFGSQSEGSTTRGLKSDIDYLYCHQSMEVIQDLTEWTKGTTNLLMLQESTAPSYCRLQLIKRERPEPEDELPNRGEYTYDESNRVILKNTDVAQFFQEIEYMTINGPAATIESIKLKHKSSCCVDQDLVFAFMCTSRLKATEEWANRKRGHGWPTATLIEQVVNEPFFLVPVGYKLNKSTKDIEWRISTSLAERCLMHSLNIVQIKCYVILKMLIKTHVTKEVVKSISSYHCKTALLYCMESTDAYFWRESNLLQSIIRCLKLLHKWVTDGFCSHIIIARANLFAGKVTSDNKAKLQSILQELIKIQDNVNSLLAVSIDGLGEKLKKQLGTEPNNSPILDSIPTEQVLKGLESRRQLIKIARLGDLSNLNRGKAIFRVRKVLTKAKSKTSFKYTFYQRATENAINYLCCFLGSMIASSTFSSCFRISKEAIDLVNTIATTDMSHLLKQASVLFCFNEIEKAEELCIKVCDYFRSSNVYQVCSCYEFGETYSPIQKLAMYLRRREVRYACCVAFSPHEIHCVPRALRYEFFRSVGDDKQSVGDDKQIQHQWMVLAVMDCIPLLFYIIYITRRTLGEEELRTQSLHFFEECIKDGNHPLCHRETAWNILGQCYEMENQPDHALECYRKSLDIRPRNNAANWLVPLLLFKMHTRISV